MSHIAPTLQQLGYTGATGTTPYITSSADQVALLQWQYQAALNGSSLVRSDAVQITLNVDGTLNNRDGWPCSANDKLWRQAA